MKWVVLFRTSARLGWGRRPAVRAVQTRTRGHAVTGFKAFLMRGNLISLAVAIVIGTAFTAVVTAFVADIITPLIAAIAGKPNFSSLTFTVHHSKFDYGLFINAAAVVPDYRLGRLLAGRVADGGAHRSADEEGGRDHQGLPGVPEHHPDRGVAVHVLHGRAPDNDHRASAGDRRGNGNRRASTAEHRAAQLRQLSSTSGLCDASKERAATENVWTRAGAWPSRVQTFCTATSVRPLCLQSGTASC